MKFQVPLKILVIGGSLLVTASFFVPRSMTNSDAAQHNPSLVLSEIETVSPRGEAEIKKLPLPSLIKPIDANNISAQSILVFDPASGTDVYAKNSKQQVAIASLTKLMTGLVTYRNAKLDENTTILETDQLDVSPSLGLIAGDTVKLQDLWSAMLVGSDNDAALALANYIERKTGRKFIALMNEQAQSLKMADTRFSNPLGFDSSYNFSSANDLKLLIQMTQQYTAFTSLGRATTHEFKGVLGFTYRTRTTNKLLARDKQIFAVKTGFTENAGGSMVTKIEYNNHSLILIVLGSDNREADTLTLKQELIAKIAWE